MEENKLAIDHEEFYRQHDKILSRFSPDFVKKLKTNPMYHTVYSMLQTGVDEYVIIEELLKNNENFANAIVKLQENQYSKYFVKLPDDGIHK